MVNPVKFILGFVFWGAMGIFCLTFFGTSLGSFALAGIFTGVAYYEHQKGHKVDAAVAIGMMVFWVAAGFISTH